MTDAEPLDGDTPPEGACRPDEVLDEPDEAGWPDELLDWEEDLAATLVVECPGCWEATRTANTPVRPVAPATDHLVIRDTLDRPSSRAAER